MSNKENTESNESQNEITDTDNTVMNDSKESKETITINESNKITSSIVANENVTKSKREIYDYMKLVFGCFIIGLVIVACLFVYLLNKVPADKLIIDFSLGDGVISIIATLIGVMVTFAIGYQILNAIQIKEDIETMQKKAEKQQIKQEKQITSAIESLKKDFEDKNIIIEKRLELELRCLDLNKAYERIYNIYHLAIYIEAIVIYIESTQKIIKNPISNNLLKKRKDFFLANTDLIKYTINKVVSFENNNTDEEDFDEMTKCPIQKRVDVYYEHFRDCNIKRRLLSVCENEYDSDIKERLNLLYKILDEKGLLVESIDYE